VRDSGGHFEATGAARTRCRRATAEEELRTLAKRSQALEAEIGSRREALGRLLALPTSTASKAQPTPFQATKRPHRPRAGSITATCPGPRRT